MSTRIALIIGSTREGRFSERAAQWVQDRIARLPHDIELDVIDLRDHPLPPFDGASPIRTPREYADPEVAEFARRVDAADGFLVLTPEYNHAYPAVLKNAIDWTHVEWNRKPVAFVSWGSVGGARAVEQLRAVVVELEAAPLRHAVHILPDLMFPAWSAPAFDVEMLSGADDRLALAVADLVWWADALASARAVA